MKTDIQIAQESQMKQIQDVAKKVKIEEKYLELYGNSKAKVSLDLMKENIHKEDGKLILVTAINPTKAGEGKSTTTIGLVDGLASINQSVMGCLREPSLGPVFGLKGGAAGGGYAQVVPMEEINLHFTGDMHAITTANNLIAAILDNHIYQGNELNIDPKQVVWQRCVDMNDRVLREVTIAQKKKTNGVEREDQFCITVATEVMAVFCLSKDLADFEEKIGECVVAYTFDKKPVTVKDLGVTGAVAVVMKEAIKPNLVQTLEHNPVLIHGGPFANIAHGCNSVIATKTALKLADYVVTEAGFGADLGAEKFLNIKCRLADLKPSAVVIVATIRALKMHGGLSKDELQAENTKALKEGISNLEKHIESIQQFGVPCMVAINRFESDSEAEISTLTNWCDEKGVACSLSEGWAKGSKGTQDLARQVIKLCEEPSQFETLYANELSLEDKIEMITKKIYGGQGVQFSEEAKENLALMKENGWDKLPVCMAKTPMSLSDDASKIGRPTEFDIHVQKLKVSAGAGFVVVYTGNVMTMPGLPKTPAALNMSVDASGKIIGLF